MKRASPRSMPIQATCTLGRKQGTSINLHFFQTTLPTDLTPITDTPHRVALDGAHALLRTPTAKGHCSAPDAIHALEPKTDHQGKETYRGIDRFLERTPMAAEHVGMT
jgi:hypothetical protein